MEQRVVLFPGEERVMCCVYFLLPMHALCWIFTVPVATPEVMLQSSSAENSWVNLSDEEMKMTFRKKFFFFCFFFNRSTSLLLPVYEDIKKRQWMTESTTSNRVCSSGGAQRMPGCCWQVQRIFSEKNKSTNEGLKTVCPILWTSLVPNVFIFQSGTVSLAEGQRASKRRDESREAKLPPSLCCLCGELHLTIDLNLPTSTILICLLRLVK